MSRQTAFGMQLFAAKYLDGNPEFRARWLQMQASDLYRSSQRVKDAAAGILDHDRPVYELDRAIETVNTGLEELRQHILAVQAERLERAAKNNKG